MGINDDIGRRIPRIQNLIKNPSDRRKFGAVVIYSGEN